MMASYAENLIELYKIGVLEYCENELRRNDIKGLITKLTSQGFVDYMVKSGDFDEASRIDAITSQAFIYAFLVDMDMCSSRDCLANMYDVLGEKFNLSPSRYYTIDVDKNWGGYQNNVNQIDSLLQKNFLHVFTVDTLTIPRNMKVVPFYFLSVFRKITTIEVEEGVETIRVGAFVVRPTSKILKDIYLPRSLKQLYPCVSPEADTTIHYHPVEKENGKKGPGFKVAADEKFIAYLKEHLKKEN